MSTVQYNRCKISGCTNRAEYGPELYKKSHRCDWHKLPDDYYTFDKEDSYRIIESEVVATTRSGRVVRTPRQIVIAVSDSEIEEEQDTMEATEDELEEDDDFEEDEEETDDSFIEDDFIVEDDEFELEEEDEESDMDTEDDYYSE